jgi:hypothetical protein
MRLTRTRAANDKCIGSNTEKRRIYPHTEQHAALIRIEDNSAARSLACSEIFEARTHTHKFVVLNNKHTARREPRRVFFIVSSREITKSGFEDGDATKKPLLLASLSFVLFFSWWKN